MNFVKYELDKKKIFLVDMSRERTRPFSELAQKALHTFLDQGKRILLINNRSWWSAWMMCHDCGHIPQCDHCDISIAWHKDMHWSFFGICHICKTQYEAKTLCSSCHTENVSLYGMGNQQLQNKLEAEFGVKSLLVESSVANSAKKISQLDHHLSTQNPQVLVWTSLLGNSCEIWRPDLIIVISADSLLHSPHYSASWNNFCFLDWLISWYECEHVILQSYDVEDTSIISACWHDLTGMKKRELKRRQDLNYPPFTEMCLLLYKHEIEENLFWTTHKLYQELLYLRDKYEMNDLEIYATPPLVYKIYGKYRYHIVLKWGGLRNFMEAAYSKLRIAQRGFKIDREPQSL